MAVTHPFDFPERYGSMAKISKAQEVETWENIKDTLNDLITRCNSANSTSIALLLIIHQDSKQAPMSGTDYDTNMFNIQNTLNAIIQSSENQGLNPTNTVSLQKRNLQGWPLLTWQRDSNFRTIQTAINSIHIMYLWMGC